MSEKEAMKKKLRKRGKLKRGSEKEANGNDAMEKKLMKKREAKRGSEKRS